MDKIGTYCYPNRTFKDALKIARIAIEVHKGIMPFTAVAKELGYTVNPKALSGTIYRNINDLCLFGLFSNELVRGAIKTLPLAMEALDPNDSVRAAQGKAKALRSIDLFARAFDAWKGRVPEDDALPAELVTLTGADWAECKRKTASIKIALTEAFQYLNPSTLDAGDEITIPTDRRDIMKSGINSVQDQPPLGYVPSPSISTPATSTLHSVSGIRDFSLTPDGIRIFLPRDNLKASWERLKKIMEVVIEEDIKEKPKTETKASSQQNQGQK